MKLSQHQNKALHTDAVPSQLGIDKPSVCGAISML